MELLIHNQWNEMAKKKRKQKEEICLLCQSKNSEKILGCLCVCVARLLFSFNKFFHKKLFYIEKRVHTIHLRLVGI